MFVNIDGETGLDNTLTIPIDANPGDIFSNLKIGGMLYFEANTNKWAITSDLVFMNLKSEVTPGTLLHSGTLKTNQFIWETEGMYRVLPFLEFGIGGRLNNLAVGADVRRNAFPAGTYEYSNERSALWFDPIVATRIAHNFGQKWFAQFRADIGGFGLGSDLTWQLQGYAGYHFTHVFQITAGYRLLSIDYDRTTANDEFLFDVNEFGPVIRFGFNF